MKTYAIYDGDGNIIKVITTTRKDGKSVIEKNANGLDYIEVDASTKITSCQIVDGKPVALKIKAYRKQIGAKTVAFEMK